MIADFELAQVQVIVVAYNCGLYLQRCVDALEAQTYPYFEVVIWDNASTDGSLINLRVGSAFQVVQSEENVGFAAANNSASRLSRSAYIAFLNPDAFAEPEWLQRMVTAAETWNVEAVAALQLDEANPEILDGAGDCMSIAGVSWRGGGGRSRAEAPTAPYEVFSACAAAALYRRDSFEALGGFEERFFCYCEDVDLGFRLRLRGGRCILEPAAVVRHVGGASSSSVSGFAEYHGARNRVWTVIRNMPTLLMPVAVVAHVLMTALELTVSVKGEVRRVRLRAIRDAMWGIGPFLAERRGWRPTSTIAIAKALSWLPFSLLRRKLLWRPATRN